LRRGCAHTFLATDRLAGREDGECQVNGQLNHLVGLEQIADMRRAAERSHLVAAARVPRTRGPRERRVRLNHGWLALRRRAKLA
jgi:hypothetical protein